MGAQIELLAPAGNRERLDYALHYGADAVYCGTKRLGLRAFADNFDLEALSDAAQCVHEKGKKIFVTLNAYIKNADLPDLRSYIQDIAQTGVDALIISDPAALVCAKSAAPGLELHLSTQANTLNYESCNFWHAQGVKRIVLARELSLTEICEIKQHISPDLELEAFVHGAMCVSYSGRCLLSNFMDGREGNRGACVQPCRWKYEIREKGKDGGYYPIEQDAQGTYLLNSNDLMLIRHLQALIQAGVTSLKIEGRMKTAFYVASVVNAYRMALDDVLQGKPFNPLLEDELQKLRHRPYTTGFLVAQDNLQCVQGETYLQSHEFVATVLAYDHAAGRVFVEQRNRFYDGDVLEVLCPGGLGKPVTVRNLQNQDHAPQDVAPHPQQKLYFDTPVPLKRMDILRKSGTK